MVVPDTITNYNPRTGNGNGFVFKTYDPKDLLVAITRALENYKYKIRPARSSQIPGHKAY